MEQERRGAGETRSRRDAEPPPAHPRVPPRVRVPPHARVTRTNNCSETRAAARAALAYMKEEREIEIERARKRKGEKGREKGGGGEREREIGFVGAGGARLHEQDAQAGPAELLAELALLLEDLEDEGGGGEAEGGADDEGLVDAAHLDERRVRVQRALQEVQPAHERHRRERQRRERYLPPPPRKGGAEGMGERGGRDRMRSDARGASGSMGSGRRVGPGNSAIRVRGGAPGACPDRRRTWRGS